MHALTGKGRQISLQGKGRSLRGSTCWLFLMGERRRQVLLTWLVLLKPGSSIAVERKKEASDLTFGKLTLGNVEPGGKGARHSLGTVAVDTS